MLQIIQRVDVCVKTLAAMFVASLVAHPALAAEEQTVDAFATWQGQGVIYETGENLGTFVGSIAGPFFIDTDHGPLDAGRIVCPAMLEVNLRNGKQAGEGKCTITTDDGARVYADWSCQGVHLVGCDGELTLAGGTGRLAGMSGSGEIRVRSTIRGLAKKTSIEGSVSEFASGILVVRRLKFAMPSQ